MKQFVLVDNGVKNWREDFNSILSKIRSYICHLDIFDPETREKEQKEEEERRRQVEDEKSAKLLLLDGFKIVGEQDNSKRLCCQQCIDNIKGELTSSFILGFVKGKLSIGNMMKIVTPCEEENCIRAFKKWYIS